MSLPSSPAPPTNQSVSSLDTVARPIPETMVCPTENTTVMERIRTGEKQVPFTLDLNAWIADNTTRYFLPQLFIASKSRLDKKITVHEHVSDAVVWNIVYIESLTEFPTESPTPEMKHNALLFLIEFRRQLNALFVEHIKQMYLNASNSQGWLELRKSSDNFVSYKDLVERTAEETGEIVSFCYSDD